MRLLLAFTLTLISATSCAHHPHDLEEVHEPYSDIPIVRFIQSLELPGE